MSDAVITITGLGGCINSVLDVIETALKNAGAEVTISNPSPNNGPDMRIFKVTTLKDWEVHIAMKHLPWGG